MTITLNTAMTAIAKTIDAAKADKGPEVALAVVNAHGSLVAFAAMDKAPERVKEIARAKAYTAARMTATTEAFLQRLRDENLEAAWFADADLTPLPGGIPVFEDGVCIGAVGISGRSFDEDVKLAQIFASYIQK